MSGGFTALAGITLRLRYQAQPVINAVYCENHMEHTDTLCGQNTVYINPVRTSQETHYVSATKTNRLMLFRETIAIYCKNHNTHCEQNAQFNMLKQVVIIVTTSFKGLM
jgi:hypothetical protein